jgi:hypothetical protein
MAQLPAEPPAARRSEEEAKAMWFAKQDAPVWGKPTEEQAKQKWLATSEANAAVLDQIRERNTRDPAPDVPAWEEPEIVAEADTRDPAPAVSGAPAVPIELQARQRWRADRDSRDTPNTHWAQNAAIKPQPTTAQHSAKAATSYPFFKRSPGDGGVHLSEEKYLLQDCEAGDQDACETLAKEHEAKKAWLGKHETRYVNPDVLSWGNEHAQQQWYNQRDPSGRPYESRWR